VCSWSLLIFSFVELALSCRKLFTHQKYTLESGQLQGPLLQEGAEASPTN